MSKQHTHAPGAPLVNWFTTSMGVECFRPLCNSLPGGDTVADHGEPFDCPACLRAAEKPQ